jgi:hypothetical protein
MTWTRKEKEQVLDPMIDFGLPAVFEMKDSYILGRKRRSNPYLN